MDSNSSTESAPQTTEDFCQLFRKKAVPGLIKAEALIQQQTQRWKEARSSYSKALDRGVILRNLNDGKLDEAMAHALLEDVNNAQTCAESSLKKAIAERDQFVEDFNEI